MKTSLLLAIVSVLMPMAATTAAGQEHGEEYDYVFKVQVAEDGKLWFNVWSGGGGNLRATHGCSTPWYAISNDTLSDDKVKGWLQLVLASYLSRTRIYVVTDRCSGGPSGDGAHPGQGYPILKRVQIEQQ